MAVPEECLDFIWCFLCVAGELLTAGATCKAWRSASVSSEVWLRIFSNFWSRRQKPELIRLSWQTLLDKGAVEPAGLSITAGAVQLLNYVEVEAPIPGFEDVSPSWHSIFLRAAFDIRTRTIPTTRELCFDMRYDEQSGQNFLRYWLVSAKFKALGPEVQFHPDGTIKSTESGWTWRWVLDSARNQTCLELTLEAPCPKLCFKIIFQFHRAADAGFVLVSPNGITIWSREATIEEHIYRKYDSLSSYPRFVELALEEIAHDNIKVYLPPELSEFECRCVRLLARSFGLKYDYFGPAGARRIGVFGRNSSRFLQARVEQQRINWPRQQLVQ